MGEWKPVARVHFLSDDAARQHLADWLFLETLADLRTRMAPPTDLSARYRILGIAPLLRKLLLDGNKTLLHKVRARGTRPAPTFRATAYTYNPVPDGFQMQGLGLVPHSPLETDALSLDELLKVKAGHVFGHDVSVADVIRHYANVEGGVHLGHSDNRASDLLQLTVSNPPPGYPLQAKVLADIALVVTTGCMPLERVVRADYERRVVSPRPDEIESPNARLGFPPATMEQP